MTYKNLQDFLNNLSEEQLNQEVWLAVVDGQAIKIETAVVTENDEYFDHTDSLGYLEEIKSEHPLEWEEIIADASVCPKGTVLLLNE